MERLDDGTKNFKDGVEKMNNKTLVRVHPDFRCLIDRLAIEQRTNKVEITRLLARKVDVVDAHYHMLQQKNKDKKVYDQLMGGGLF